MIWPVDAQGWSFEQRRQWADRMRGNRALNREDKRQIYDSPLRTARLNARLRNAPPDDLCPLTSVL